MIQTHVGSIGFTPHPKPESLWEARNKSSLKKYRVHWIGWKDLQENPISIHISYGKTRARFWFSKKTNPMNSTIQHLIWRTTFTAVEFSSTPHSIGILAIISELSGGKFHSSAAKFYLSYLNHVHKDQFGCSHGWTHQRYLSHHLPSIKNHKAIEIYGKSNTIHKNPIALWCSMVFHVYNISLLFPYFPLKFVSLSWKCLNSTDILAPHSLDS